MITIIITAKVDVAEVTVITITKRVVAAADTVIITMTADAVATKSI